MTGRDAALVAAFEHGMAGDQLASLEDLDLVGERLHLEDAPAGGVGHAVIIIPNMIPDNQAAYWTAWGRK